MIRRLVPRSLPVCKWTSCEIGAHLNSPPLKGLNPTLAASSGTPIAFFGGIDLDSRMVSLYDVASSAAHAAVSPNAFPP